MSYVFPDPKNISIFTVFSKSNCKFCTKVKILLEDKNIEYETINCDEWLNERKDDFLNFIKLITNKEWKTFPMVFNDKGEFIGGFTETENYLNKLLDFDNNSCDF
jgi:glutaredoxin